MRWRFGGKVRRDTCMGRMSMTGTMLCVNSRLILVPPLMIREKTRSMRTAAKAGRTTNFRSERWVQLVGL